MCFRPAPADHARERADESPVTRERTTRRVVDGRDRVSVRAPRRREEVRRDPDGAGPVVGERPDACLGRHGVPAPPNTTSFFEHANLSKMHAHEEIAIVPSTGSPRNRNRRRTNGSAATGSRARRRPIGVRDRCTRLRRSSKDVVDAVNRWDQGLSRGARGGHVQQRTVRGRRWRPQRRIFRERAQQRPGR